MYCVYVKELVLHFKRSTWKVVTVSQQTVEWFSTLSTSRFCVAITFYGISFNITGFGLNIYLTQFTYAVIELPAKISVYYLLDKIGRRCTEVGSLLLAGICLGINIAVPKGSIDPQTYIQALDHSTTSTIRKWCSFLRYVCCENSGSSHWKRVFFSILWNSRAIQLWTLSHCRKVTTLTFPFIFFLTT